MVKGHKDFADLDAAARTSFSLVKFVSLPPEDYVIVRNLVCAKKF